MDITVTLTGSLEEIAIAINAMEQHKKRAEAILPMPKKVDTTFTPKPRVHSRKKRAVEIHLGSIDSGFVLHKIFDSGSSAAENVGMKNNGLINHYLKTGKIYRGMYKFFYHE